MVDHNNMNKGKENYLNDFRLRHNLITCPFDNIEYNKYVKKELYYSIITQEKEWTKIIKRLNMKISSITKRSN